MKKEIKVAKNKYIKYIQFQYKAKTYQFKSNDEHFETSKLTIQKNVTTPCW